MVLPELDLATRLGFLLLLFGGYAALDAAAFRFGGRWGTSERWRALGTVAIAGAFGAAFGCLLCASTFALEPRYFSYGHGLGFGPGLEERVLALGVQGGAFGGALFGCWMLVASERRGRSHPDLSQSLRTLLEIIPYALAGVLSGALVGSFFLGQGFLSEFRLALDARERYRLAVVWALNNGAILGVLIGAVLATRRMRR